MMLLGDLIELRIKSDFADTVILGEVTGLRSDQLNPDNEFILIGTVGHWFSTADVQIKKLGSRG